MVGVGGSNLGNYADDVDTFYKSVAGISEKALAVNIDPSSNATMKAIAQANAKGKFFESFLSLRPGELAQTLVGSHLTNVTNGTCPQPERDGEKTCLTPLRPKGALAYINLFLDLENIHSTQDFSFKYYKCDGSPGCTSTTETQVSVPRLLPKLRADITELWDTIVKGNVELTQNQKLLSYFMGNDMTITMKKLGYSSNTRDQYVKLKSLMMTRVMMDYLEDDFVTQTRNSLTALRAANQLSEIPELGINEVLKNVDDFHKHYENLVSTQLTKELDNIHKEFSQFLLMKDLSSEG
ncbi:hypothetical protein [Shewanella aestuarii]|uniref:Uncharacterized protein n=1 Tax=Shewanella aestuarii TaxID=1028752 RepID=A0A6G9QRH6_9GAMM|nr:hypothetical protein [Shewanella aestuarii]QIR16401.1 hypothetical protein HBH39_18155 [Shewanella aestuarii]